MTTSTPTAASPDASIYLVFSVVALGFALEISNGHYHPAALVLLTCALVTCIAGVLSLGSPADSSERFPQRAALAVAIAVQAIALLIVAPGVDLEPPVHLFAFRAGILVECVLIAAGVAGVRWMERLWFPAVLIVQLSLGVWMMHASPSPHIDVVAVHREAIDALLRGNDPYQVTFENIYSSDLGYYNPKDVVGGRVQFGYPYPPLSLLLAVPGQAWAGDYRYAELAALLLGAALIGYVQKGTTAKLAAALLLTTPRAFFVLEQGWTEPIAVLLLALTVFSLVRKPALTAWAAGLLVVSKQYMIVAVPLLVRLVLAKRGRALRFAGTATCMALVVTLPLALWHPHAFVDDLVFVQMREPFRIDSLSYLSLAASMGWGAGSLVWSIVAACMALLVSMIRTPNTPAGLAASLALSSFAMFAFGSKAFCNYYFFVIAAMCCAIATQQD